MREDREEVAKGVAVVHELAIAGDQGMHAPLPGRLHARLRDRGQTLVVRQRVDHGGDERRLAAEVVAHGVAVGARLRGHALDGKRLEAAARQKRARGRHEAPRGRRQPCRGVVVILS